MSVARVLIADAPIPSPGYGSWSQRMEYLLQSYEANVFNYIICSDSPVDFQSATCRRFNCKQYPGKIINKLIPFYRFREYKKALKAISEQHDAIIIGILDSKRAKHAVWKYINDLGIRHKCTLVYYQCGFSTYLNADQYERLTEGVSHFIYLTENAYRFELEHNPSLPFVAHVLHNPINHQQFFVPSDVVKASLRHELGMNDGVQFIWASQDRPKKGLDVVLHAWKRFYRSDVNATLHVVGVQRDKQLPAVIFHGKKPNHEMHKYFKAADIGVFSSLWTEGFSLSLAEQISCGLLCIASTAGCVDEFFIDGEHGIAIDCPNIPEKWMDAFQKGMQDLPHFKLQVANRQSIPFLTYDEWCKRFCNIFSEIETDNY